MALCERNGSCTSYCATDEAFNALLPIDDEIGKLSWAAQACPRWFAKGGKNGGFTAEGGDGGVGGFDGGRCGKGARFLQAGDRVGAVAGEDGGLRRFQYGCAIDGKPGGRNLPRPRRQCEDSAAVDSVCDGGGSGGE